MCRNRATQEKKKKREEKKEKRTCLDELNFAISFFLGGVFLLLVCAVGQRDMIASEKLGLLLADWGYNTQAQREKAAAEPFAVLTQNTLAAAAAEPDLFRDCHKDTLFISDV